jgi:hypothetical protein
MKYFLSTFLLSTLVLITPYFLKAQQYNAGLILNDNSYNNKSKGVVGFLPLLNKNFIKKGHSSPLAFGIGTSAFIYQQEFISKDLKIKTTTTLGLDIYARGDSVSQNTKAGELKAYVKPSIWIFPFLNVYGLFGYTSGRIKPDLYIKGITIEDLPGIGDYPIDTSFALNEEIQYYGNTYGMGATFSMGFRNLILFVDYHFTVTKPSDLDGKLNNHFLSPKLAYSFNLKSNKNKLLIWAGAMYFNNNQSFTGDISVKEIAPELVAFFGEKAEYSGTIEAKNNWNALIGSSIDIGNHHTIFMEIGLLNRQQTTIGYNFMF